MSKKSVEKKIADLEQRLGVKDFVAVRFWGESGYDVYPIGHMSDEEFGKWRKTLPASTKVTVVQMWEDEDESGGERFEQKRG